MYLGMYVLSFLHTVGKLLYGPSTVHQLMAPRVPLPLYKLFIIS